MKLRALEKFRPKSDKDNRYRFAAKFIFLFILVVSRFVQAGEVCTPKIELKDVQSACKEILKLTGDPETVFGTLQEAIEARAKSAKPVKSIVTDDKETPSFPSYSKCEKSFFRVATINKAIDEKITNDGWKSGWARRMDEIKEKGQKPEDVSFDALPPTVPFEERIVQYVRVKNVPSEFPKHSTVIGVLENPVRTLSVGYHTGYNSGVSGNYMRMDEIEIGPCAESPKCKAIAVLNSTEVFSKKGLKPRYSTEGEWAVENEIPPECVVATYRLRFQKVDDKCYSDTHGNCKTK